MSNITEWYITPYPNWTISGTLRYNISRVLLELIYISLSSLSISKFCYALDKCTAKKHNKSDDQWHRGDNSVYFVDDSKTGTELGEYRSGVYMSVYIG